MGQIFLVIVVGLKLLPKKKRNCGTEYVDRPDNKFDFQWGRYVVVHCIRGMRGVGGGKAALLDVGGLSVRRRTELAIYRQVHD